MDEEHYFKNYVFFFIFLLLSWFYNEIQCIGDRN